MSSWLFLPNPFNSEDNDDQNSDHSISTLFRSVAAFLAPPPTNSPSAAAASDENGGGGGTVEVSSRAIAGMKHDLAEIGDRFKSSVSLLSSRFFKAKEDDPVEEEEMEMIGITEEVVDYVSTLSERPQLWTDFPISLPNDFEMSVNQREHVENIEQLVPALGSLRQRVSGHLPNNKFWMIYFILLLPRLDENDLELLSTPKASLYPFHIVEVKDTLMQQLQNKKARGEVSKHSNTQHSSLDNIKDGSLQGNNNRTITSTEAPKAAEIEVSNAEKPKLLFKNEGAVSFSDVEDDDNDLPGRRSSASLGKKALSSGESHEWVHVGGKSKASSVEKGSDSEGSCEWLTIDDVDSDTMATP
nr:serine-rich adhesin for platelets-like [Ipomoea batatas]